MRRVCEPGCVASRFRSRLQGSPSRCRGTRGSKQTPLTAGCVAVSEKRARASPLARSRPVPSRENAVRIQPPNLPRKAYRLLAPVLRFFPRSLPGSVAWCPEESHGRRRHAVSLLSRRRRRALASGGAPRALSLWNSLAAGEAPSCLSELFRHSNRWLARPSARSRSTARGGRGPPLT